ncbi:acetone carboxylase [Arthrobacter sp. MYb227]|uniref:acetone carboxylase n=1 Tax=Arthrobacter sp. MYb227 TaxID=1848601 RepID=UPI000CFD177E|nr:acetone carboxylase [Arthrobacter sp. MYb227]PQZ87343.1 acetone carboxylase [Arthrobacter sp. MYb227]
MNLLDSLSGSAQEPVGPAKCSRKGCRSAATTQLLWNNPKIHTPERRKIWLACNEHASWLENYLSERLLFKERAPLDTEAIIPKAPPADATSEEN